MVRPKRNNSNAAKKRLAPRIKHGITVRENSAYNMINKNHITIPRPGWNVSLNMTKAPLQIKSDTKYKPITIRKKPTMQNTYTIPKSVNPVLRRHGLKQDFNEGITINLTSYL